MIVASHLYTIGVIWPLVTCHHYIPAHYLFSYPSSYTQALVGSWLMVTMYSNYINLHQGGKAISSTCIWIQCQVGVTEGKAKILLLL